MRNRTVKVDEYRLNVYSSTVNQPRPESYREDKEDISDLTEGKKHTKSHNQVPNGIRLQIQVLKCNFSSEQLKFRAQPSKDGPFSRWKRLAADAGVSASKWYVACLFVVVLLKWFWGECRCKTKRLYTLSTLGRGCGTQMTIHLSALSLNIVILKFKLEKRMLRSKNLVVSVTSNFLLLP